MAIGSELEPYQVIEYVSPLLLLCIARSVKGVPSPWARRRDDSASAGLRRSALLPSASRRNSCHQQWGCMRSLLARLRSPIWASPRSLTVTLGAQVYWLNNMAEPIQISNQVIWRAVLPADDRPAPAGQVVAGADSYRLDAQTRCDELDQDPIGGRNTGGCLPSEGFIPSTPARRWHGRRRLVVSVRWRATWVGLKREARLRSAAPDSSAPAQGNRPWANRSSNTTMLVTT